ncbi:hypothetical protein [Streptomyces sp. NPDC005148]
MRIAPPQLAVGSPRGRRPGRRRGAGVIAVPRTSLSKITFEITGSTGTPKIAEYETYAG